MVYHLTLMINRLKYYKISNPQIHVAESGKVHSEQNKVT